MRAAARPLAFVAAAVMTAAMAGAQAPKGPAATYSALEKLPDWRGVWSPDWGTLFPRGAQPAAPPPYTAQAKKALDDYKAGQARGENLQNEAANCTPPGMPGIMRMPYPIEFLLTPGRITLIAETDSQVRRIYTDGRPLPDDPDPTFNGSSIGHWEGDTLVVDTIALNPKNSIVSGLHVTENTRIRERMKVESPDRMVIETTFTDPALFTAPFTQRQAYVRKRDWDIREYVCSENNKDAADAQGRPSMDLN